MFALTPNPCASEAPFLTCEYWAGIRVRRERHTEDKGRQRQIDTGTEADIYMRTQAQTRNSTQIQIETAIYPLPALSSSHPCNNDTQQACARLRSNLISRVRVADNHARSSGFVTRIASSSSIFFLCASFFSASYSSSANLFASRSQPCGSKIL
jgi:hypothetical protein